MALVKPETKILIVEDEAWERQYFQQALERLGYSKIEVESNGITCVEKARNYMPHLILLDTNLPGQMGYEACRQIRAEPWGTQMAILGMSSSPFAGSEWQDTGSDSFVHKDIFSRDHSALGTKIQKALGKYF